MPNQMLILCGGLGTRLKPLTDTVPKPMLKFNEKPFLEYLIKYYSSQKIKTFILSVGYFKKVIIDYFSINKNSKIKIEYSEEKNPLGTAGAIKKAKKILDNTFLVANGDTFTEIDLKKAIKQHHTKNALCTICVIKTKRQQNTGYINFNKELEIKSFRSKESTKKNAFVNTGIYILNKEILDLIPKGKSSLENDIFPKIKERLYAYPIKKKGYFIDIGTFKTYYKFRRECKKINL